MKVKKIAHELSLHIQQRGAALLPPEDGSFSSNDTRCSSTRRPLPITSYSLLGAHLFSVRKTISLSACCFWVWAQFCRGRDLQESSFHHATKQEITSSCSLHPLNWNWHGLLLYISYLTWTSLQNQICEQKIPKDPHIFPGASFPKCRCRFDHIRRAQ